VLARGSHKLGCSSACGMSPRPATH
jgi:hypothetical protein